jgi:hypothetical protein
MSLSRAVHVAFQGISAVAFNRELGAHTLTKNTSAKHKLTCLIYATVCRCADLRRLHNVRLATMARLKSTHFPELDLSSVIKSGLGGPLLRAGLIVDNFELSALDHDVLSTEGRHPVYVTPALFCLRR